MHNSVACESRKPLPACLLLDVGSGVKYLNIHLSKYEQISHVRPPREVVCGRFTRTHRPMEWKRDRSFRALARTRGSSSDNESCFFVLAAGVH
ncbi:hypothetical protein EVAR_71013_1 [Eumeta japonica]|uniref:Uncharacterized protein n=1 Tax=Eumeta variegata TaxID=151549 RepID=A0A4C1SWZ7_EUMVA|nr:hypothetical protein EVAR_71013_1 [Eumeta japonica]